MQNYQQDNGLGKQDDQPESVLNIIRKEFFDMGGHDKDDDLKNNHDIHKISFINFRLK